MWRFTQTSIRPIVAGAIIRSESREDVDAE